MHRSGFYKVGSTAFLFPAQSHPESERDNPEEPVRQWCAYELIRAYGISIGDIEFERQVRVGSKIYRIDILVSQNGRPWAVVECKEPSYTKHEDAMAQAISYADGQEIQAEFAIYTNGQMWHVRRRIQGQWAPVPDIPAPISGQGSRPITELLRAIHEIAPMLYKLDEPIKGSDAREFLSAMQRFFHGWNLLTWGENEPLHSATDNLLRVLSVGKNDPPYIHGKLEAARSDYENFRLWAGFPYPICPASSQDLLSARMRQLHVALLNMSDGTKELAAYDAFLLRLNVALLEYGHLWSDSKEPHPALGPNLHNALRAYLSYALSARLNVSLPDVLDNISIGDMKSDCKFAWDQIGEPP